MKNYAEGKFGWIHLQHTRIAVAFARWHFLLFLSLKTIKNASGQMRQLSGYVANESTHSYTLISIDLFTDTAAILN